ncbi:MAG: hypothetical protein C0483_05340 [Pirellula sp.]|nr:hypothetical protein [Pirellula sp.]
MLPFRHKPAGRGELSRYVLRKLRSSDRSHVVERDLGLNKTEARNGQALTIAPVAQVARRAWNKHNNRQWFPKFAGW